MQSLGSQFYYPQMAMMGAMTMAPTYQAGMMSGGMSSWGAFAMQQSDRLQGMYAGFVGVSGMGYSGMGMGYAGMGMGMGYPSMGMQGYGAVGAVGFVGYMGGAQRIEDDPNGVGQSGQGLKSNLANSPEVMLAMKDLLGNGGFQSYEDTAKGLKEKYGIQCEVGDIKIKGQDGNETTAKGIKFANGDYFIDGNGNGGLDTGDYKFDDAVKNLKDKYGLTDDGIKSITDRMKSTATAGADNTWGMGPMDPLGAQSSNGRMFFGMAAFGMQGMGMQGNPGMQMYPSMFGNPMMNRGWMNMFGMAFQYAR